MPPSGAVAASGSDDRELLRSYVERGASDAFSELVSRHVNWVYSAAFRQTGNHATAQDVVQAVFIILASKAGSLKRETVLAGWLFRAVRYAVRDAIKIETRRQRREQEAAMMQSIDQPDEASAPWQELAPMLDEALEKLSDKDRNAVLLRFFEKKDWRDVGASLGLDENAARVRTGRAVEKLRVFFHRRGIAVSAITLSTALLTHAVQAAPSSVPATLTMTGPPALAVSASAAAMVKAAMQRWRWRKAFMAGAAVVLLLAALGIIQQYGERQAQQAAAEQAAIETAKAQAVAAALREMDRAYSFNNPDGFVARIHFRNAHDEQFRPALTNYLRAGADFRSTMRQRLRSLTRPWYLTFNVLIAGQSSMLTNELTAQHFISAKGFGSQPIRLVETNGLWKWDFFHGLSPVATEQRLTFLNANVRLLDEVTARVRLGQFTKASDALALLPVPASP